jgi:ankyrin repeat protein
VKLTLAQLSKGLNSLRSAYAKVIERIEGQLDDDCALAKKVMSWVTYAKRPLRTAELRCALAVEPGKIELDPENLLEVEDIVSVCAGLVVHDQVNDVFRLMHHTTQGYLEDISKSWEPGPQLLLTTTCLTYLSFDAFKGGSCSQHELNERLVEHKFLNYAANHWGEHARSVEDAVADLACSLLLHDGFLSCDTQANHYYSGSETYRDYTALHFGAYFNLPQLARIILRTAETDVLNLVNAKTGDGHTPLLIATAMGHSTMVELLLQHGAEDDSQDKSGLHGRALQRAACYGHEHIVKLLLDAKSSVNAEELYLGHALCSASTQGHEQMVELLLSRGADINAIGEYGTALTCAIRFGHKKLATWLIGKGADVNADTRWYASALHSASFFGYMDILILLLDAGADVNAPPGPRGSALWAALKARYMGIAKVLIAAGAVAIEPSHVFRGRPRDAVAVTSRPKGRRSASVEMRLPSEARVATPQAVSRLVTGAGSVQTKTRLRLTLEEFVRQVEEAEAGLDEGEQ